MKNLIRKVTALTAVQMLLITSGAFAQEQIRQDNVVIGKPSTAADKALKFDTNDGASNPSLSVEKVSKKLKYSQNDFQLGGSSTTDSKSIIFNGDGKSLLYEGTANELQYNGDFFSLGDGTNTEKTLKFNKGASSPQIKWNPTTSKLQFSNNAVDFKDIGAGGGSGGSSGVNLIANESFEDGIASPWTSSGGTFSQQTYAIGSDGNLKYARFVASTSGQYVEQIVSVPTDFSAGCQADFKKVNIATASLFKVQALDASNNVLAEQTIGVSPWIKVPTLSFPCPASGANNLKLRLISLAAGTIDFDRGYIGSNQNIVNVNNAKYLGKLTWITTAGCQWSNSSTSWSSFAAVAACPSPIVSGSVIAPATKIPAITIPNFEKGTYQLIASGAFATSTTGGRTGWRIANTAGTLTTSSGIMGSVGNGNATYNNIVTGVISNGAKQSNVTLEMQAYVIGANASIDVSGGSFIFSIEVYFTPDDAETAVSPEQSSWFIDANIGGGNASSSGNISTYTELTNPTLDLVINTSKGSASAEIACASGTASTGLTCTSNESVGIAFVPALTGLHRVCFDFGTNTSNNQTNIFQVIETPNTSQTILQEGGSRVQAGFNVTAGSIDFPNKVCGNFVFSDTSKRTIRLMTETNGTGTTLVLGDRSATLGQRDIHVTVENLTFGQNRPILTGDQVTMNGNKNYTFVGFDVSATGVVANADNPSIAPTSCSVTSGNGTCVFPVTFANRPKCSVVIDQSSSANQYVSRVTPSGGNTITYTTFISSTSTNSPVSIFCLVKLP